MATADQRLVTEARLTTDLSGKAAAVHAHPQSDVTGLETRLAAYDQDTGWRNLSSLLANGWTGSVAARRIRNLVMLALNVNGTNATALTMLALPTMLAPSIPNTATGLRVRFPVDPVLGGDDATVGEVVWVAIEGVNLIAEEFPRTTAARGTETYMTTQVWNATFPGTAL